MNKSDLIANVTTNTWLNKKQAGKLVNSVLTTVSNSLQTGDHVTLAGFGTFSLGERSARTGRNPRTGAELEIGARKVVKFKPGKVLADKI